MSDTMDWRREHVAQRLAATLDTSDVLLRRWAGCWIDFIAIAVLNGLALAPTIAFSGMPGVVTVIIFSVVTLGYFPLTEGVWGRSMGKLITGTIVVDAAGRPPGLFRVVVRTLMRLVEVNPFLLGGLPAGISVAATKHRQRIGDLAAGTYVVPLRALEAARRGVPNAAVFD
jgi:uncharacterized RDD family membrane protein YckC